MYNKLDIYDFIRTSYRSIFYKVIYLEVYI